MAQFENLDPASVLLGQLPVLELQQARQGEGAQLPALQAARHPTGQPHQVTQCDAATDHDDTELPDVELDALLRLRVQQARPRRDQVAHLIQPPLARCSAHASAPAVYLTTAAVGRSHVLLSRVVKTH